MTALVIFWASVLAVLFFLLGTVFKAIASGLNAVFSSIGKLLAVVGLALFILIASFLLYGLFNTIAEKGLFGALGTILLDVVIIGILGSLILGLGGVVLSVAVTVAVTVLEFFEVAVEWLATKCENLYYKFLQIIIKNVEKC